MSIRASKVAVKCHCTDGLIQITPAGAVIIQRADQEIAGWLCPTCRCFGTNADPAMVQLLKIAGARRGPSGVFADYCDRCDIPFLTSPAEILLYLSDDETGASMQRRDCPICGRTSLERIPDTRATTLALIGVRTVGDVLDLVPDEADALTDPSVDLHQLLALALGTDAPHHD